MDAVRICGVAIAEGHLEVLCELAAARGGGRKWDEGNRKEFRGRREKVMKSDLCATYLRQSQAEP
jgi:hydroxymethylglutaryl-CoA reductase